MCWTRIPENQTSSQLPRLRSLASRLRSGQSGPWGPDRLSAPLIVDWFYSVVPFRPSFWNGPVAHRSVFKSKQNNRTSMKCLTDRLCKKNWTNQLKVFHRLLLKQKPSPPTPVNPKESVNWICVTDVSVATSEMTLLQQLTLCQTPGGGPDPRWRSRPPTRSRWR